MATQIALDATGTKLNFDSNTFVIDESANRVGIGTATPSYPFHINNSSSAGDNCNMLLTSGASGETGIYFGDTGSTAIGRIYYDHSTNGMTFKTDATNRMTIDSSGKVGIGTTSPWSNLSISSGGLSAVGDETNPAFSLGQSSYRFGMYTTAEGAVLQNKNGDDGFQFKVKTAGDAVRIDGGTGNVGIGTTNPAHDLDINSGASTCSMRLESTSTSSTVLLKGVDCTVITQNTSGTSIWTWGKDNTNNQYVINYGEGSLNGGGGTGDAFAISTAGNVGIGLLPTANMTGLAIEAGVLTIKETTTPSADTDYGKVYTKNDNKLYFQDGAGTEHEIAFVP